MAARAIMTNANAVKNLDFTSIFVLVPFKLTKVVQAEHNAKQINIFYVFCIGIVEAPPTFPEDAKHHRERPQKLATLQNQ